MTGAEARSLTSYPPGMTASEVHEAGSLTEHSRRQLEADGLLVPVEVGRKRIYPRWQVFALLGMVDPDVAVADAARASIEALDPGRSKAPTGVADAPDVLGDRPNRANEEVVCETRYH